MEVTIQTQEVRVFTTEMRRRRVQRVCRRWELWELLQ